uniref:MICAL-like protein 1 isoform X2 n=1 Tax=Diabrotica virgifera virgifera TaxID=50390 RepID=A0A6P7FQY1_DIAVI
MNERRGTKGLELWCRKMTEGYPGVKIDNMTTSWRDGLAFCAIIHHFRPDLIDFSKLNKDDVYHNNELAFRVAEQYLGIPALLEPEDMVEYAVPDRLSILTYLSQFYQAFAVREGASTARIAPKRPQAPSDHGIVSPASTSPPTKVALTAAGKLRREPCAKCGLPVFIAERLNVGKSLFHRTCFRCARCNSQLTLANYYETENSEFCCEICPDEEKLATKTSAQKAVLQRSMSDEEKTASLKNFTDGPDEFSAVFESALENADIEKIQTLGREFNSVRSDFFKSQIKASESSDSGTDDKDQEPPDLPKSLPPAKDIGDSVISAQIDTINRTQNSKVDSVNSTQDDSGFPKKDIVHSGLKDTLSFDQESQNVVTKDESFEDSSLVKTRRRLFENDVTDIKADVNRKTVPLSTFTSIPSSINKSIDISDINEDTPHSSHTPKKTNMWQPVSARYSPKKEIISSINMELNKNKLFNNQKQDVIAHSVNRKSMEEDTVDENKDISIVSINSSTDQNKSAIEISSNALSNTNTTDSLEDSKSIIEISSSVTSIKDTTEPSLDEDRSNQAVTSSIITLDDSSDKYKSSEITSSEIIDESLKSINESIDILKDLENSSEVYKTAVESDKFNLDTTTDDSFKLNSLTVESIDDISTSETSNIDRFVSIENHSNLAETKDDSINENSDGIVEAVNDNIKEKKSQEIVQAINTEINLNEINSSNEIVETAQAINKEIKLNEVNSSNEIVETVNYNVNNSSDALSKSSEVVENTKSKSKNTLLKMESYPEDLNPFDDEPPTPNDSLNPFGSEDEEEEVSASIKPMPSPRFKKKVLDASDVRKMMESPMKDVDIVRISVNPFEENDTEKPVPARRRKKISVPKISFNPFSSDDDDNETEEVSIRPVPAHRQPRLSTDAKPRESLLSANLRFGSNSSISSESYYGSARKKRPAPRPPIPGLYGESNASSLTSTPSQSVQHSPKATPKQRKNKRAPPPPPKFASTPIPSPKKPDENTTESQTESSIKPDDLQQEKTAKDEVNRNRQSQDMQNDPVIEDSNLLSVPNKSTYGKWKRKKGLAPTKPVPQKRTIRCLPMTEIKKELEFIEIQQQGLEKQGVRLEQIIREKCEGKEDASTNTDDDIPIEVEDLILQLFELVNEKNELFRKQTELMYLRRQQRLEEEHADVEYQIRCLMMQPEANKTDSDKAREEELIKRKFWFKSLFKKIVKFVTKK